MNLTDLLKQFFAPSPMVHPPTGSTGVTETSDWAQWQKRLRPSGALMDMPNVPSNWPVTPDHKLPAYSPTTGFGQSGTAY